MVVLRFARSVGKREAALRPHAARPPPPCDLLVAVSDALQEITGVCKRAGKEAGLVRGSPCV